VTRFERDQKLNDAIDRFLDSYAEWIRTKGVEERLRLVERAKELEAIDPGFSFPLEEAA